MDIMRVCRRFRIVSLKIIICLAFGSSLVAIMLLFQPTHHEFENNNPTGWNNQSEYNKKLLFQPTHHELENNNAIEWNNESSHQSEYNKKFEINPEIKPPKKELGNYEVKVESKCQPKHNVAFSKTHKCGSSTLQNIMFRYGYKHHLKFVLPPLNGYSFLVAGCIPFRKKMIEKATWHSKGYNMMAIHSVWDNMEVRSIMPSDTIHISIVRDPVDLFQSLYHYYNFEGKNIYDMSLENFLKVKESSEVYKKRWMCLGRNQMLFDFGLPEAQLFNESAVKEKIEEIDRSFDYILIAEYFEESLILLRDLLCWETKDILYLSQNRRKTQKVHGVAEAQKNRIRALNREDDMLYQHFLRKFNERMKAYGEEKLKREVQLLMEENEKMKRSCVTDKPQNLFKGRFQPYGRDTQRLFIKEDSEYCAQFATVEMYFMDMIRKRQR